MAGTPKPKMKVEVCVRLPDGSSQVHFFSDVVSFGPNDKTPEMLTVWAARPVGWFRIEDIVYAREVAAG